MNEKGGVSLRADRWRRLEPVPGEIPASGAVAAFVGFGEKLVESTSGGWLRGPGVGSKHACLSQPALDLPAHQLPGPQLRGGADPPSSCLGRADARHVPPPPPAVGGPPHVVHVGVLASARSDPERYLSARAWPGLASGRLGDGHFASGKTRERQGLGFHSQTPGDCAQYLVPVAFSGRQTQGGLLPLS